MPSPRPLLRLLPLAALVVLFAPPPASAQSLPAEQLRKIKAATTFITVDLGPIGATGSGFLVRSDPGVAWVVTNDHVVALQPKPGRPRPPGKPTVTVVFHSGTKDEWSAPAEVVARDPERDLAMLRVPTRKTLPDPLSLSGSAKVAETTPVYVCGFPFGEMLAAGNKNPEISIGQASVSSIRSNDQGEVVNVQLNGSLNPGNSGGPVVTTDGKLLGVLVAGIKGSGIGFAIPVTHVSEMIRGRVSAPILFRPNGDPTVVAAGRVVDPMGKVRRPRGYVAPVGSPKETLTDLSKRPQVMTYALAPVPEAPTLGVARLNLHPGVAEVWVQSEWTDVDGTTRRTIPMKVKILTPAEFGREEVPDDVAGAAPGAAPPGGPPSGQPGLPGPPVVGRGPGGRPLPGGPPQPAAPPDSPAPPAWAGGPTPPQPQSPAWAGGPSPSGPPPAGQLPPTPPGQVEAKALNADVRRYLGQRVAVDVLATRVSLTGYGDGPSLVATDGGGARLGRVDFVVDRPMADRLIAQGVGRAGGSPVAARVRGVARGTLSSLGSLVVVVDEVQLLADGGAVASSVRRGESAPAPAPAEPVRFPTPEPEFQPAFPEPTPADEPVGRAAVERGGIGTGAVVLIILGGGLFLLVVGGIVVWLLMGLDGGKKKPERRGKRRRRRDDYDD